MSFKNQIDFLIQGYQRVDPRLYDVLRAIAGEILNIDNLINEFITPETVATEDPTLPLPAYFTYSLPGDTVKLDWGGNDSTGTALSSVSNFEIRKGTIWNSALFVVRTTSLRASLAPDLPTGSHTYLLKTINKSGSYSSNFLTLVVNISAVSSVTLTASVIDNNVLLYWNEPDAHSFNIAKYELFRDGDSLGLKYGTFAATFESVGGIFSYSIIAYDLADNFSADTTISVRVSAPPDFELVANILSIFDGSNAGGVVEGSKLIIPIFQNASWESHFTNNSWDTIQDQLDAGYPYYLQPSETTGLYEEVFDFGLTITGGLVNVSWGYQQFDTSSPVTVTCEIEGSEDNINWSDPVAGTSAFFESIRYARVSLTFTPNDTKSIIVINNLYCSVDIKYGVDSGDVIAAANDSSGTAVLFNKDFKDINSITLTVASVNQVTAVYDFTDVPNPTGFSVYLFDAVGNRADGLVS